MPRRDDDTNRARIQLRLLGTFRLTRGDQELPLPTSGQRVLAFLALQSGPVLRSEIAGTLWIDALDDQAHASLRSALWRIRRVAGDVITSSRGRLAISPSVTVDVRQTADLAMSLVSGTNPKSEFDPAQFNLRLLPGWYEDWVLIEQERLRQLGAHALEELAWALASERRYGSAIDAGLAAVQIEPLRETAHRVVIAIHLLEGNRGEALAQYRRLERLLRIELDMEPGAETLALLDQHRDADTAPHGRVTATGQSARHAGTRDVLPRGHGMAGARQQS